ncbi:MAG: penicillin-binding protein 2 [Actinomycetota bacterium]|nr:penicillin-binding protein 2 [Actinomycetota bacterium]
MNRPLRRMAAVLMAMFLALLVNATYVQGFAAEKLREQPSNSRQVLAEYDRQRGPILVDRKPVARSTATKDRLRYLRRYPSGRTYAHVTGYYSYVYGADQVERAGNGVLAGTGEQLAFRRAIDVLTGREREGGSVELTLDPRAQEAAAEGLAGLGEDARGAVVALDPTTGAVLAMASRPTYDPNDLSSHDGDAIRAAWKELTGDPANPLLNRGIDRTYPPGSTFKIVTAAAALSSGRYTPEGDVPGPARLDLPLTTASLPNYDNRQCTPGRNTTTLVQALERSCNTTFGAIGMELGAGALADQAAAFGFGQSFEVPMSTAASAFPQDPDQPQTAQSAIGQYDVQATPLQMAMVAAGVANGGVVMRPQLVEEVLGPDFSRLDHTDPSELGRAVEPEVAAQLRDMMVSVVENGTGTNAQIPGVKVAGKTGTAQVAKGIPPHAWFVSFAPAEAGQDPRVAVAVVVENGAQQAEVSGNRLAAPIARAVTEAVLSR